MGTYSPIAVQPATILVTVLMIPIFLLEEMNFRTVIMFEIMVLKLSVKIVKSISVAVQHVTLSVIA